MSGSITCVSAGGRRLSIDLASLLTPDLRETARSEANAWIKRLRLADYGGVTMRQRFRHRGDSLWWFTELYLHKMRRLDTAVSTVLALEAARAAHGPSRLEVASADQAVRDAAVAFGSANGVPVDLSGEAQRGRARAWPSYLVGLTARLSRLRPARATVPARRPTVAAYVHTAFWRAGVGDGHPERDIGPVLEAIAGQAGDGELYCVGVGPRRNFRARKWWDPLAGAGAHPAVTPIEQLAPREALQPSLDLWSRRHDLAREILSGDGIRAAARVRGVDLWPVLSRELESAALLQWPWSARAMDEAGGSLDALRPQVVLTYAEAGGWGRALVLEARRRGVPSVGLQHGFIYRHWLNYQHEADELAPQGDDGGFPAPDRTLVFDGYAADHLREVARLPPQTIVVTGSAGRDDLAARIAHFDPGERRAVRRSIGAADGRHLALVAAKFSELGEELPALVEAARGRDDLHLAIKTHPAETAAPYERLAGGADNISIAAPYADLAALLAVADGVITRNSTVAVDALALGVPALVIGLPSNLSPFVDAGVMLGAAAPADVSRGLEALLYDREARHALRTAAEAFVQRHAMRPDGGAARRAAAAVLGARRSTEVNE
jgi:hypothetical protein